MVYLDRLLGRPFMGLVATVPADQNINASLKRSRRWGGVWVVKYNLDRNREQWEKRVNFDWI